MRSASNSTVRLATTLLAVILGTACNRIDQKKFDGVYRAGKAIEVDIVSTNGIYVAKSEELVKQLKMEIALLDGRTSNSKETDALAAYSEAADAYKHFLDIRSLDLSGQSTDGRMLLGDGWLPAFAKYGITYEPAAGNDSPSARYKFFWIETSTAITAFSAGTKKWLAQATSLVNN